jgi:hypothetical protein
MMPGFGVLYKPIAIWVFHFQLQLIIAAIKGIENVFEKNEAEDHVFVFGSVQVAAQFVGSGRQGFFELAINHKRSSKFWVWKLRIFNVLYRELMGGHLLMQLCDVHIKAVIGFRSSQ